MDGRRRLEHAFFVVGIVSTTLMIAFLVSRFTSHIGKPLTPVAATADQGRHHIHITLARVRDCMLNRVADHHSDGELHVTQDHAEGLLRDCAAST